VGSRARAPCSGGSSAIPDRHRRSTALSASAPPAQRAERAMAIAATLTPDRAFAAALAAYLELEGEGVYPVCGQLVLAAVPGAEGAFRRSAADLVENGAPQRPDLHGNPVTFTGLLPLTGIGVAMTALAKGELAPPETDSLLQAAYGFDPVVRDALRALPPDRREAWLLDPRRDDRAQPAEFFKGAWPYWAPYPSRAVTERVLMHVATWKKKDPWGGARTTHADPLFREYVAALRAKGEDDDARRREAALAALTGA
jgi:hypothetical protein